MVAFNRMIHDVANTHRRQMQRVVAMSENSIAAVMAFDAAGSLVYCNRAALALCGAGNAAALNRSGYPMVLGGDASPMPLSRYLSGAATTEEITLEVAPGRSVPCVVGGNRLHGEDGAVELSYASILEISEMQAYRERLEIKNVELAAANRAKNEFLAHMSHELRTPLNAILGFSEMMSEETLGPLGSPRYREYAADINESGTHLLNIISDILDLSKIEAGKTELSEQVVDVPEMLAACRRLVAERATSSGIELAMEWRDPLPALRADPRLLKQIVLNLLSNAIKFTSGGGTVTVRVEHATGGALSISVSDSGCGMAPEDIPTALAPFGQVGASLMSKQAGTGLGLPLVKSFVELHQGWLHIDSELGSGTIVTVSLPEERVIAAGSATASRSSAA
jgi:signal transduction histidine kinase